MNPTTWPKPCSIGQNNMAQHNAIGKEGEEIAKRYLENHGYGIIDRNYRTRYSEIDFIAQKGSMIVFIEVRTRTGEQFGSPEETLRFKKKRKLFFNARSYMAFKKIRKPFRIDAVCIVFNPNQTLQRISHYENIVI